MIEVETEYKRMVTVTCGKHGVSTFLQHKLGSTFADPKCQKCAKEANDELDEKRKFVENKRNFLSRLALCAIPKRFTDASFENYIPSNARASGVLGQCRQYASSFPSAIKNGQSLIFSGSLGNGKTHLAAAIANAVLSLPGQYTVRFLAIGEAIDGVFSTFSGGSTTRKEDALKSLTNPDLLILDEVGVQYGSEVEKTLVQRIIGCRYDQMRPTILISNLSLTEMRKFLGDRVIDRMKDGGGKIFLFDWESYRK